MIKVKICGLRNPGTALRASEDGADFIGMVFVPKRRRTVSISEARAIVQVLNEMPKKLSQTVGLFANQPLYEVIEICELVGLDMAQLCGNESIKYCKQVPIPLIKSVHIPRHPVPPAFVKELFLKLDKNSINGHIVALDSLVPGLEGGTGKAFNWNIGRELSKNGYDFILSGGLNPDNLLTAIRQVRPWGVDVSSGVETNGEKDVRKISEFISISRQLEECSEQGGGE